MFQVNNKNTRTTLLTSFWCFFLLNLNMFHNFFYCVYCWLRASKCKLGASFTLKNLQILQIFFVPSHDWAMDLGFRSRFLKKKFEKNVIGIFRRSIISHYLNHIELIFFIVCNCGKISNLLDDV